LELFGRVIKIKSEPLFADGKVVPDRSRFLLLFEVTVINDFQIIRILFIEQGFLEVDELINMSNIF
jgi:hypothetical protein